MEFINPNKKTQPQQTLNLDSKNPNLLFIIFLPRNPSETYFFKKPFSEPRKKTRKSQKERNNLTRNKYRNRSLPSNVSPRLSYHHHRRNHEPRVLKPLSDLRRFTTHLQNQTFKSSIIGKTSQKHENIKVMGHAAAGTAVR